MLKKIPVRQLTLGMHLHAFVGSWVDHPFWRSRFLIEDPATLRAIQESGVAEVWIDVSRGRDVAEPKPAAAPAAEALPPPDPSPEPAPAAPAPPAPSPVPLVQARTTAPLAAPSAAVPLEVELAQAGSVVMRSRRAVLNMFREARMGQAVDAGQCLPVVEEIGASVVRNAGAVVSLARLKTHDDYSYMHSVATCALMISLARQLGLDEDGIRTAGLAGLLHDVGKATMPNDVLNKPGKLTDDEFRTIREHPQRGYELLRAAGTASEAVMDVVLHHHERMDGKGYPHALPADRIGLMARMGAVCDVYDAVTSVRPYKAPWDPSEALSRMASWTPAHFDGGVFQPFVKALGIYPIGSLVRLQSGRIAVVVEQNPQALTSPIVRAFFSTRSGERIAPVRIDLSAPGCADRITQRESNKAWGFQNLDELWAGREVLRRVGH